MMKPINTARFVFLSRSVNESFARGALAAFLAQADPTVPQLADKSPSTVILEPKKMKFVTVSIVSPSICHEVMGPDAIILVF